MTASANTEPHRQPSGAPTGGQFATTTRTETDTVLDPGDSSRADDAFIELTGVEMVAAARQSVRTHAYRQNIRFEREDDMVQSTLEAVLRYKRNNGQIILTRPYIHTVGAGIVAQTARGRLRAEDRKAMGIFNRKVAELDAERGKPLTSIERDRVAARIRADWADPRHRPSVNFVTLAQVRVLSLDATIGSGDSDRTLGDTLTETMTMDADDLSVEPDTLAGQVLSGERGNRAQNRADAWEIYASLAGLPAAVPLQISLRHATQARGQVADGGGVCAAARTWLSGETSTATQALFSPFGALDESQRDDVTSALIGRAAYAEELWNSAMSTASRRVKRESEMTARTPAHL